MEFRTVVDIPKPDFEIAPCEPLMFVGSCCADSIGARFREEGFPVVVNPFGVMYNPASILHTIERYEGTIPRIVVLTLGTNHVYRLKETGEIVDNCQKRPQHLFHEEMLTVDQCADYLCQIVALLQQRRPAGHVVLTCSPIRYRKYGYHGSQLSKATLLLAVEKAIGDWPLAISQSPIAANNQSSAPNYFPSYELLMDELRDYRFYADDMLHPSQQAVAYIWERLVDHWLSKEAKAFLDAWRPMKQVLTHRPFHPDTLEYQTLMDKTMLKVAELRKKYPTFAL